MLSSANTHPAATPASPARTPPLTVHLIGPGSVGRALLGMLRPDRFRVIGVTDSRATCHDRRGLAPATIARHKSEGGSLAELPGSEELPVNLAVELVDADVLVDSTPTELEGADDAVGRCRAALQRGRRLALAAKHALVRAAGEWLSGPLRHRVGCNAVLGGTGRLLVSEWAELSRHCREIALVPNASTTAILQEVERGASLEEGVRAAQAIGLLEADPGLDLDGSDAAVKLAIVVGALWGQAVDVGDVERQDLRSLDASEVRRRAERGRTTRLVARAGRAGPLSVTYEDLSRSSPLSVPPDRVAYGYGLEDGRLRVHTGSGLGPEGTARALLEDIGTSPRRGAS